MRCFYKPSQTTYQAFIYLEKCLSLLMTKTQMINKLQSWITLLINSFQSLNIQKRLNLGFTKNVNTVYNLYTTHPLQRYSVNGSLGRKNRLRCISLAVFSFLESKQ